MNKLILKNLLNEVSSFVPYYRSYVGAEIEEFPFITKNTIKEHYSEFISDRLSDKQFILGVLNEPMRIENYVIEKQLTPNIFVEWTTGSSGIPFKIIKEINERNRISLNIWKRRMRVDKCITPATFYPLIHTGQKALSFDIRDYSYENLKGLYEFISNSGYLCIHTTPTLLKRHVIESKMESSFFLNKVKYIESTGSYLSPENKTLYEEIFGATVLNFYGLIEVWTAAYTCKYGHMHVINDNIYLELIDENRNVINDKGKFGQIAVTGLHQKTMPFIRYLTGDFAAFVDIACPCGDKGAVIELRQNRLIHFVSLNSLQIDGNKFVKKMLRYVFWQREFPDINYFSLIQKNKKLSFYMNPIKDSVLFERLMSDSVKKGLGMDVDIQYLYVSLVEFESMNPKNHLFINKDLGDYR